MTTPNSLPQDPAVILTAVESFFDALPPKRRRRAYEPDATPEIENYGSPIKPPITIQLDGDAQVQLPILLRQLSQMRSEMGVRFITDKIYGLLGVELEGGE